jgi:hypothetical protein
MKLVNLFPHILCVLQPASVPFPHRQHRSISQHVPGQFAVVSLHIFAVLLLKPSLSVLRYGVLLIFPGLDFSLQFFSELALLFGGSTHLCFKLMIGIKVSL